MILLIKNKRFKRYKYEWDECHLKFDLNASNYIHFYIFYLDLTNYFNWNIKQLFLYINVEFKDPESGVKYFFILDKNKRK